MKDSGTFIRYTITRESALTVEELFLDCFATKVDTFDEGLHVRRLSTIVTLPLPFPGLVKLPSEMSIGRGEVSEW
jgi:hypothetical protein